MIAPSEEASLDTFKDIWELGVPEEVHRRNQFRYLQGYMGTFLACSYATGSSCLDTFKDIWELPGDGREVMSDLFRYLQGYMGTTTWERLNELSDRSLDTFKDIWEPVHFTAVDAGPGLDTFKDIWELTVPLVSTAE